MSAPPSIIDIPIPRGWRGVLLGALLRGLGGGLFAGGAIALLVAGWRPTLPFVISFVVVFAACAVAVSWLVVWLATRRALGRLRPQLLRDPAAALATLRSPTRLSQRQFRGALAHELLALGHGGLVARFGRAHCLTPVEPLNMPLEPTLLNEADDAIAALAGAEAQLGEDALLRRVRRNVTLSGGWLFMAVLLLNLSFGAVDAIRSQTITVGLVFWGVLTLLTLFFPLHRLRFGAVGRQWFVVPGGLVLRCGGWRGRGPTLRLFDRAASVLLLAQPPLLNRQWIATLASGDETATLQLTTREHQVLLACWYSTLPPPKVELLTDLG